MRLCTNDCRFGRSLKSLSRMTRSCVGCVTPSKPIATAASRHSPHCRRLSGPHSETHPGLMAPQVEPSTMSYQMPLQASSSGLLRQQPAFRTRGRRPNLEVFQQILASGKPQSARHRNISSPHGYARAGRQGSRFTIFPFSQFREQPSSSHPTFSTALAYI
jgi:hypothetical protein